MNIPPTSRGGGDAGRRLRSGGRVHEGDSCVEIATAPRTFRVRDSKHTAGPRPALAPGTWTRFVAYAASER
ncbi:DUF397 domain-containing protein [Streptomyces coelicoflavus]|uniref:DUF397 domain-containing protein n=1 Tax=Streptomyces coelicoflavus TaxID=285562 RepID=A0A6N9UV01_9ACTN|nr:DUF397 domain-containing protein [Streptomyces coelicoflavus]NEB20133.1 DUF397 domain-containing protein [Streptomyces coelicoflavus]